MPLVEGAMEASPPEHVESNSDGVQILVVGSSSGEDMYLISTPDKDAESSELRFVKKFVFLNSLMYSPDIMIVS